MRCESCGSTRLRERVVPEWRDDDLLGIDGVELVDAVVEYVCRACRATVGHTIPNLGGLVDALAVVRAAAPGALDGRAIVTMRHALGLSGVELAALLRVRKETVSRWENSHEKIGATSEQLLRLIVLTKVGIRAPASLRPKDPVAIIASPAAPARIRLRLVRRSAPGAGWRSAA